MNLSWFILEKLGKMYTFQFFLTIRWYLTVIVLNILTIRNDLLAQYIYNGFSWVYLPQNLNKIRCVSYSLLVLFVSWSISFFHLAARTISILQGSFWFFFVGFQNRVAFSYSIFVCIIFYLEFRKMEYNIRVRSSIYVNEMLILFPINLIWFVLTCFIFHHFYPDVLFFFPIFIENMAHRNMYKRVVSYFVWTIMDKLKFPQYVEM